MIVSTENEKNNVGSYEGNKSADRGNEKQRTVILGLAVGGAILIIVVGLIVLALFVYRREIKRETELVRKTTVTEMFRLRTKKVEN